MLASRHFSALRQSTLRVALHLVFLAAMATLAVAGPQPARHAGAAPTPLAASERGGILQLMRDGGLLMVPITGCSIVLLLFIIERSITLRRRRVLPRPFITRFLQQLNEEQFDVQEALLRCSENGSPISHVFAAAVKKWNRSSVEVEQAVLDAGERVAYQLRRYLRLFNGIATISPLLGLLGTVVGMIESFEALAGSGGLGRPELLAAGIGKALITTAAGLVVAIPALTAYLYFNSRVDRLIVQMDQLGQQVVAAIACDAWKDGAKRTTPVRSSKAA